MKYSLLLSLIIPSVTQAIETRVKIGVIDTGVYSWMEQMPYMCKDGAKNLTPFGKEDDNGHGSHIVNIIGSRINSRKYCITSFKVFHKEEMTVTAAIGALILISQDDAFNYVNISMNGVFKDDVEYRLIDHMTSKGIKFTIAAGNESKEISRVRCDQYPACYKFILNKPNNFYVIGAYDSYSNWGSIVDVRVSGTVESLGVIKRGTSQAAASYMPTVINSN